MKRARNRIKEVSNKKQVSYLLNDSNKEISEFLDSMVESAKISSKLAEEILEFIIEFRSNFTGIHEFYLSTGDRDDYLESILLFHELKKQRKVIF